MKKIRPIAIITLIFSTTLCLVACSKNESLEVISLINQCTDEVRDNPALWTETVNKFDIQISEYANSEEKLTAQRLEELQNAYINMVEAAMDADIGESLRSKGFDVKKYVFAMAKPGFSTSKTLGEFIEAIQE